MLGVDASCGAAGVVLRMLAVPAPEGVRPVRQHQVKEDLRLRSSPSISQSDLLNPSFMPAHVHHVMVSEADRRRNHAWVYVCMYVCICMCVCMYVCRYVCMYQSMYQGRT